MIHLPVVVAVVAVVVLVVALAAGAAARGMLMCRPRWQKRRVDS